MSVTRDDVADFHRFADERLAQGEVLSLVDLVALWEEEREIRETAADIRASLEDYAAGRVAPLADAFANVRKKLGPAE
jgi:hypothetical protein